MISISNFDVLFPIEAGRVLPPATSRAALRAEGCLSSEGVVLRAHARASSGVTRPRSLARNDALNSPGVGRFPQEAMSEGARRTTAVISDNFCDRATSDGQAVASEARPARASQGSGPAPGNHPEKTALRDRS
jgi:hypothetical protein